MELFNERILFYNVSRLLTNEGVGLTDWFEVKGGGSW